jgi:hypothetical protein
MYRKTLGLAVLALSLAACNNDKQPAEKVDTPPPAVDTETKADITPVTDSLPMATDADITVTLAGADLTDGMKASGNISVDSTDGIVTLTRVDSSQPDNPSGNTSGASIAIPNFNEIDLSGKTLSVTVSAKSSSGEAAPFTVAYSTARKGNSGWQEFVAGSDFKDFTFEYLIPTGVDERPDFVGISVPEGATIDVNKVSIAPAS